MAKDECYMNMLCDNLLVQVFCLLPIKSITQCKSVCKSWLGVISSDVFVRSHLNANRLRVSYISSSRCPVTHLGDPWDFTVHSINSKVSDINRANVIDCPFNDRYELLTAIYGSCNGLLLVSTCEDESFWWNPSNGEYARLYFKDHLWNHLYRAGGACLLVGLGHNSLLDEYKVVLYTHSYNKGRNLLIYSSRTGYSKKADYDFPYKLCGWSRPGVTVDGYPHWVLTKFDIENQLSQLIFIYFDTVDEEFKTLVTPTGWIHDYPEGVPCLGLWDGHLCVTLGRANGMSDVWVMKVRGCWTKLFAIPCLDFRPLALINDGGVVVLVHDNGESMTYNFKTKEEETLIRSKKSKWGCQFTSVEYSKSLVSPSRFTKG